MDSDDIAYVITIALIVVGVLGLNFIQNIAAHDKTALACYEAAKVNPNVKCS